MKLGIFLAEGFEEVEALAVVDIVRRAGMEIDMVSVDNEETVTSSHGITVKADKGFDDAAFDEFDMLILPGGMPGTTNLLNHTGLVEKLKEFNQAGKMIGAICAAPMVLGENGILEGKNAVCHPGFEKHLIGAKTSEETVMKDGNIITSRGMGTAIPFGLAIVEHFKGMEAVEQVRKGLVY